MRLTRLDRIGLRICAAAGLLFVGPALLWHTCGQKESPAEDPMVPIRAAPSVTPTSATLWFPRSDLIPLAIAEADVEVMIHAFLNERAALTPLLANGQCFASRDGAPITIIETRGVHTKVRLIDGDNAGREGWIPRIWTLR